MQLVWLWAVRTRHEDLAPPSYLEVLPPNLARLNCSVAVQVTKPPSYSSCRVPAPAPAAPARSVRLQGPQNYLLSLLLCSPAETEPPAYSELYTRQSAR